MERKFTVQRGDCGVLKGRARESAGRGQWGLEGSQGSEESPQLPLHECDAAAVSAAGSDASLDSVLPQSLGDRGRVFHKGFVSKERLVF